MQAFLEIVVAADAQQTADQPGEVVVVQDRAGGLLAQVALCAELDDEPAEHADRGAATTCKTVTQLPHRPGAPGCHERLTLRGD
nr:hypothetical protein [Actinoplanes hulinensis]